MGIATHAMIRQMPGLKIARNLVAPSIRLSLGNHRTFQSTSGARYQSINRAQVVEIAQLTGFPGKNT